MAAILTPLLDEKGEAPALIDERGTTTFAALDERVNRLVHALRDRGLATGDTIAVLSGNRRELFEVFLAAAHGGWVVVPINWHWVADEVAYVIDDAGAVAVVVDGRFADAGAGAAADPRTAGVLAWIEIDPSPDPRWPQDVDVEEYEAVLAGATASEPTDQASGGPMFYTSGTTGTPKGVRSALCTTGLDPAMLQLIAGSFTGMLGIPAGGVTLLDGPAYHSAQWVFSMFPLVGGSTVVMRQKFDAAETLRTIDEHGVTNVHLVPTQFIRLLRLDADVRAGFRGESLAAVFHGAAPCPADTKRAMLDWFGPVVHEYYGGTEAGFVTMMPGSEWPERPTSIGTPVDIMEVEVLDDDGNPLPPGETGQIWFRSKMGTDFEYHGDPDKTAAAHRDGGWGTLGDVGHRDADGYLHLSDRRIDMIISGGVNIYPAEIEGALAAHPSVADAAVFGVPDEEMGEQVMAVVELVDGARGSDVLAAELEAHCRERLAGYKAPRRIEFSDELPRHPTGKLYKRLLRDPYWEGTARSI